MKLLAINAGSSSLKFSLFDMSDESIIASGLFERIGDTGSCYSIKFNGEKIKETIEMNDHNIAVKILLDRLINNKIVDSLDEIEAVGHRIVHGADKYSESVKITDEVIKDIEAFKDLAPLHNPAGLKGIEAFKENIPDANMVACFDTAFHQTMDEISYLYPVPYEWYEENGVRKYGFHGLSHKYISEKMSDELGKKANLIICHIGSGASISAVKEGKCVDTSMGLSTNAGIMMGTRSGDIDYSIIPHIMRERNMTLDEVLEALNKDSGLQGSAGVNDLRDIDEGFLKNDPAAVRAVEMYTTRIAEYIAKYYVVKLNGDVDAICFTAGGGENDPLIRKEVLNKLTALGINVDEAKNDETVVRKGKEGLITTDDSKVPVYVFGTDEELMIARDTHVLSK